VKSKTIIDVDVEYGLFDKLCT